MFSCASRSAGPRRIGKYGSQAAKPNLALPAAGGSAGVRAGAVERAKAGAEGFGGDANAGKPGRIEQQQWKGRADRAVRDASGTGYVCGEGARDRGTGRQERASDPGTGCKGCGGETLRGEGEAAAGGRRFAGSPGGGQNGRCGERSGGLGKTATRRARPAAGARTPARASTKPTPAPATTTR